MTGASGSVFGIRLLEALKESNVETHLIASKWAQRTMEHETSLTVEKLRDLADVYYGPGDMGAQISSGSFDLNHLNANNDSNKTFFLL